MNQENEQIKKIIMSEQDIINFKKNSKVFSLIGFKGLDIEIFTCPIHPNELLACISGLGHTLNMLYWIELDLFKTMYPIEFVQTAYDDFKDFVVFEREEMHNSHAMH